MLPAKLGLHGFFEKHLLRCAESVLRARLRKKVRVRRLPGCRRRELKNHSFSVQCGVPRRARAGKGGVSGGRLEQKRNAPSARAPGSKQEDYDEHERQKLVPDERLLDGLLLRCGGRIS
ncbi:hypothetical protein MTO96_048182 [Rhipicephalus appendiculatus]